MKKMKVFATIGAMLLTCSMVSTYASTSGWKEVQVNSNNAVYVYSSSKTTNSPYTGAYLSAIGAPDTILYWAYGTSSDSELLTSWSVTEGTSAHQTTYGSGKYISGASSYVGKGVKVTAKARDFCFGSFPIQTDVNFY